MYKSLIALFFLIWCSPIIAATISDQVTSPLTNREESIDKNNQLHQGIDLKWGGRLLLRAGEPVPLDGNPDTLRVGSLELAGDFTLFQTLTLHGLILYEQQITDPPDLDELYVSAQLTPSLQTQLGRQYVPFGNYDTAMINMPLTQYLGETRAEAINLVWETDENHLAVYYFNQSQTASPVWGWNVGINQGSLEGNISWISNLAASGAFSGDRNLSGPPSAGIHVQWTEEHWVSHIEWIGALNKFETDTASWDGRGAQPQTVVAELRLRKQLFNHSADFAISWQKSWEATFLSLPQQRWMATTRWELLPSLNGAIEWMHSQAYTDAGDPQSKQRLTAQLELTF